MVSRGNPLSVFALCLLTASAVRAADPPQPQPDPDAAKGLPSSPALPAEPSASPWKTQASLSYTQFELFLQGAPFGWSFSEERKGYAAMARIGPGLYRRGDTWGFMAFGAYEVSRFSYSTFGAHALLMHIRTGLGGHVGVLSDTSGRLGGAASFCWFGPCLQVEHRATKDEGNATAVFLTLTLPVLQLADEFTYLRRTE